MQVAPTLVATAVPTDTKQIRVRGRLASAAAAQNQFVLTVQPFMTRALRQQLDITALATAPAIIADSTATNGLFAMGHAGGFMTDNFNSFASFVAASSTDLNGTAQRHWTH